jgi:hypothetical protein
MSETQTHSSTDLLRSLRLVRSPQPDDRQRGIAVLSTVRDDPRVTRALEHLYQTDPDPGVREAARRALLSIDPSVPVLSSAPARVPASIPAPAPVQSDSDHEAAAAPPKPRRASIPRQSSGRALFLLNPSNAAFVAREMKRMERQKKHGRIPLWLAVIALLGAGMMWAFILDAKNPDDHLIITAAALSGAVIALLILGTIRRRGGLRNRRVLRGQIVECNGRLDDDGDFKIMLHYRFRTPADRELTGQVRQIRNDLRQKPLPRPGTPVAVFYRSARSHWLL